MSLRLLFRDHPARAFAITTGKHALVFRHSVSLASQDEDVGQVRENQASKFLVEFSDNVDLSDYRALRASGVYGTLGLITVGNDLFLCIISGAVGVATVRPNETVQRILSVDFYCLNSSEYDPHYHEDLDLYSTDISNHHRNVPVNAEEAVLEHPCQELKRTLSGGTFYYSVDFDLTNRLQDRLIEGSAFDIDSLDNDYLWNQYMINPLIEFRARLAKHEKEALDLSRILTSAIRGFVSTMTIFPSADPTKSIKTSRSSALTLISRLSCRRAGTRFNARGIDDDGNVANFVETETIFWNPLGACFSYTQVRGSVPVFWEQATGLLPGQQKIQLTRSAEATQPAFDKHFESLEFDFGAVNILNLLSESKPGEAELSARYRYHIRHSPQNQVVDLAGTPEIRLLDVQFDFHAEMRGSGYEAATMVKRLVQRQVEKYAYFLCHAAPSQGATIGAPRGIASSRQEGVFRTNCLDCLDRTNLIQTILSQMAVELFLNHRGDRAAPDFWIRHSSLWADNGDALSKIYAGTGALKSSFTRHGKMSLAGAIADARKSATRLYMNNFVDKGRQNTIDMLLGRLMYQSPVHLYDPITDHVNAELKRRLHEYSSSETIHIWVGTFNLNGKAGGVQHDLTPWFWPEMNQANRRPEIVAVGFQEIVELSPQQIMSTDPVRRQAWEHAVRKTLNDNAQKPASEEYVLLRSGQLVGAALMIFVKSNTLNKIKNVEGSVKKTGMSGMAGNKGAVAIRMEYANSRLCFVTAHLAAGFANYEERNRDYHTITQGPHGLHFQRNRTIEDHDAIIWAGDFNYRIGLSDDKVRRFARAGDLDSLYQNDQLNLQMVNGRTFPFYSESRISFMPTYKYDNGTDNYDTSEKARIPAWCDRVLRKGEILKQINYATAPLRFSDHRPVYATFQCTINVIDEAKKEKLSLEIYSHRRADIGDVTANARDDEVDDEELIGYDAIAPELPPASSDRHKWWLDGGLPSRSDLSGPKIESILNDLRPNNPFASTTESDWLAVPKTQVPLRNPNGANSVGARASTAAWNGTRMISPTFEPQKRLHMEDSIDRSNSSSITEASGLDGTSKASQLNSMTSVRRKPAPPIPKKPDLLASSAERRDSRDYKSPNDSLVVMPRIDPTTTPEFQYSGTSRKAPLKHSKIDAHPTENNGPLLSIRETSNDNRSILGLLDDEDEGASEILPLQPQQRG